MTLCYHSTTLLPLFGNLRVGQCQFLQYIASCLPNNTHRPDTGELHTAALVSLACSQSGSVPWGAPNTPSARHVLLWRLGVVWPRSGPRGRFQLCTYNQPSQKTALNPEPHAALASMMTNILFPYFYYHNTVSQTSSMAQNHMFSSLGASVVYIHPPTYIHVCIIHTYIYISMYMHS